MAYLSESVVHVLSAFHNLSDKKFRLTLQEVGNLYRFLGFRDNSVVKNPSANTRDVRDAGWILRWGRFPGGGHDIPL